MSDATAESLQQATIVAFACVGAMGTIWRLGRTTSTRFAGLGLLTIGWLGLLSTLVPMEFDAPWWTGPCMIIPGAVIIWFASQLLERRRGWIIAAAGVVLPLRIPVPVADESFSLLAPLYALILIAASIQLRIEHAAATTDATAHQPRASAAWLIDLGIAGMITLSALSLGWTYDVQSGAVDMGLFLLPFALLALLVRSWLDDGGSLRPAALGLAGTMTIAALVGTYQHGTHTVWQNQKVRVANMFAPDFRTNSIFWDPNIYGRYLVFALAVLGAFLLYRDRDRRTATQVLVVGAVMCLGLWYTYSQSSLIALAAMCITLVGVGSSRRWRLPIGIALAACIVLLPVAAGALQGRDEDSRSRLVAGGFKLASLRPVQGLGLGSFETGIEALAERRGGRAPSLTASHTSVMTVLVELGVLGVGALLLLLIGAAVAAFSPGVDEARLWAAAVFVAVFAHSMFYAALLEDPVTWIAVAVLAQRARGSLLRREAAGHPHTG